MTEKNFVISSFDLDRKGFVRQSSDLKFMQQAALEDLFSLGVDSSELRKNGAVFVLAKMRIKIYFSPRENEKVCIITAPQKTLGATFFRNFKGMASGRKWFFCASRWVLIDFNTRKILRPSVLKNELQPYEFEESLDIPRISIGEEKKLCSEKRKIYRSMLDENDHLNNAVYADMVFDMIPAEKDNWDITIEFLHEAYLGEEIEISLFQDGDLYKICALKEDGTEVFRASAQ